MKKFSKIFSLLGVASTSLFANNNNISNKLATSINEQITNVGSDLASVVNTASIVMGVIWIIVMLLMAFFNMEQIKQNAKLLFGALVIIGVIYGLSSAMMGGGI
ncbi:putative membrane protein [Campylobacter vicugnae]|uniref:Membrane protein n=1 Tax=Campylobacter vicugnae TaxID=1660076 RepID=A0A1X9T0L7_9BACT|nr:hypothetical protein [Campylobacter sp. RM8964]ARR02077.1 putative membrane protein [Campylobacter sp. RM8964]